MIAAALKWATKNGKGTTKEEEAANLMDEGPVLSKLPLEHRVPVLHNPAQYHCTPKQAGGGGESPGEAFVTVGGPYDALFISLRHVVFLVEKKSATPVSQLMRKNLKESVIYDLINEFSTSGREAVTVRGKKVRENELSEDGVSEDELSEEALSDDEVSADEVSEVEMPEDEVPEDDWMFGEWECDGELKSGETAKPKAERYPKLWAKMEEARAEHAGKLYDREMRDVDILYTGEEAKIRIYKDDREAVMASGGVAYHLGPYQGEPKTMGMSIIVSIETLQTLFHAGRTDVKVVTNTAPAPYIPPPVHSGTMFPKLANRSTDEPSSSNISSFVNVSNEESDGAFETVEKKANDDGADQDGTKDTKAIDKAESAKRTRWTDFPGSHQGAQVPNWSGENHPFSKVPGVNEHAWWQDDEDVRHNIIQKWKRSNESDDVVLDEVPNLCETFVTNRNYDWHEKEIGGPDREVRKILKLAEYKFFEDRETALKEYQRLQFLQRHAVNNPYDVDLNTKLQQEKLKMMKKEQSLLEQKSRIVQLRNQAKIDLPVRKSPEKSLDLLFSV